MRKKRKKDNYIIYFLIIIAVIIIVLGIFIAMPSNKSIVSQKFQTITTGTTDQGDVTIDITPKELINGKLNTEISINTHSVDISMINLKEEITLEYNGKAIKPISAPKITGHHTLGNIVFDVNEPINEFIIVITNIPKLQSRIYEWR